MRGHSGTDVRQTHFDGSLRVVFSDTVCQTIEPFAYAVDAGKEFGIDKGGDWLAAFADDDAVLAVLDLIEQGAEILAKMDVADFGDHRVTPRAQVRFLNHPLLNETLSHVAFSKRSANF